MSRTAICTCSADTYGDNGYPTTVFGGVSIVNPGSTKVAYFKFNAPTLAPNEEITEIKFNFYCASGIVTATYILSFGDVKDVWNEGTLTYDNRPTYEFVETASVAFSSDALKEVVFVNPTLFSNLFTKGISITGNSVGLIQMKSKEAGYGATLTVTIDEKAVIPSTPVLTKPAYNAVQEKILSTLVEWAATSQYGYELQHSYDQATWATISATTADLTATIAANTFSTSPVYMRIRYKQSASGAWSAYSPVVKFYAVTKPSAPTSLTSGAITTNLPTITWTFSGQTEFNLVVLDGTTEVINVVVSSTTASYTLLTKLIDQKTYTVKVRAKDTYMYSDFATSTITTNFLKPNKPVITAVAGAHYVTITIDNPSTGNIAVSNDIYKQIDGVYVRIATGVSFDGSFVDYGVGSGTAYSYKARALTAQTGYTDSDPLTRTVTFLNGFLTTIDGAHSLEFKYGTEKSEQYGMKPTKYELAGRNYPVTEDSNIKNNQISRLTFELKTYAEVKTLKAIIDSALPIVYQDQRGRVMFVDIDQVEVQDKARTYLVNITGLMQIDYVGVV